LGEGQGVRIPANVRNYTPRIGGMDARKISAIALLFIISAIIFHFSMLISIVVASGGSIFILFPTDNGFLPSTIMHRFLSLFHGKAGMLRYEIALDCGSGICIFREKNRIFSVICAGGLPYQMMKSSEIIAEASAISKSIDQLTAELTVMALPVKADLSRYVTGSPDDDSMDYDGLVSFLVSDSIFYKPYFFLSFRVKQGMSPQLDTMRKETEEFKENLQRAGLVVDVISEVEDGREILKQLSHDNLGGIE
jgi:hypothetical protein